MPLNVAKRGLWTTIDMEAAIDIYNTEKSKPENARMSVRQISLQHNVPYETLRRRILGLTKSAAPCMGVATVLGTDSGVFEG